MKKIVLIIGFLGFALQAQSYLYIWQGGVKTDSFIVTNDLKIDFRAPIIMGVPCPGTPTVTYEGKTYNTVQIGTQCWLKENLNVGTRVNGVQNQSNNSTIEKYCYNDDEANCNTYGGLYQWNEAMQYSTAPGTRGICPPGWHIPANAEFETLAAAVNNDGNALKAIGQGTGSGQGTDTSGFSALLAGLRDTNGGFIMLKLEKDLLSNKLEKHLRSPIHGQNQKAIHSRVQSTSNQRTFRESNPYREIS